MARQTLSRSTRGRSSQGPQNKREGEEDAHVPIVYQELLEEAEARDPESYASNRPIKRRKVDDPKATPIDPRSLDQTRRNAEANKDDSPPLQTAYDSSESEESDIEWEDVEMQQLQPSFLQGSSAPNDNEEMLQITLAPEPEKRPKAVQRRKPLTKAERRVRLDVHKSHLLCLLGHVHLRNRWCNDDELQVSIDETSSSEGREF